MFYFDKIIETSTVQQQIDMLKKNLAIDKILTACIHWCNYLQAKHRTVKPKLGGNG